jgi:MinD-like ATPase involved in chromosome partitioning or flagellar assembly
MAIGSPGMKPLPVTVRVEPAGVEAAPRLTAPWGGVGVLAGGVGVALGDGDASAATTRSHSSGRAATSFLIVRPPLYTHPPRSAKVQMPMATGEKEGGRPAELRVKIRFHGRDVDARLPADVPVGQLVPEMLRLSVPAEERETVDPQGWTTALQGGAPFPPWSSLAQLGVVDGSVVELEPAERWTTPALRPADALLPHQRSLAALPKYSGAFERIAAALLAGIGRAPAAAPAGAPVPGTAVSPLHLAMPEGGSPVERARRSWRGSAYNHRLDDLIQAPRLRRCVTIAVVSPKGGVGKTTITALLGGIFAMLRRDRIVAVDTNPDFGSLGRSLVPTHGVFVDDLLEVLDSPELTATELDAHLARGPHGLMIVPAPTDPARMARLDQVAYTRVIRALQEMVGMVLLDCGTGMHEPALRSALETADQLVLVSDADPATASLVAEAAMYLRSTGLPMWLVVNRMPSSGSRLRVASLEEHLSFARGLVLLPSHEAAARRVASGAFDWREAPGSWSRAVRQLATVLAASWPEIGAAV